MYSKNGEHRIEQIVIDLCVKWCRNAGNKERVPVLERRINGMQQYKKYKYFQYGKAVTGYHEECCHKEFLHNFCSSNLSSLIRARLAGRTSPLSNSIMVS